MHRTGHLGASLLAFAPIGFALVRAGEPLLAYLAGATMLWFAMLPDYDLRISFISHRGPTHTFLFAALVGGAFGAVGYALDGPLGAVGVPATDATAVPPGLDLALFGFGLGVATVLAHLLADALTPMGVRPFWPVWDRRYTLGLVRAANPLANYALFVLGVFAAAAALVLGSGLV